jgi:poly(3-hydroxybutyrate) depolymerase
MRTIGKMFLVVAVAVVLFQSCKKDQVTAPEPVRYLEETFKETSVQTVTYSIPYSLEMDIYQPAGDTRTDRPVVVFAHGGSFVGGTKQNPYAVELGHYLARRGYVMASIQYRLAPDFYAMIDSITAIEVVMKALGDGRAAVRYFRESAANGNPYGIDPDRIFFGGNSAGAVLAVHAGYLTREDEVSPHMQALVQANGGINGNSGNAGYSSSVKAIFALAGGINRLDWIEAGDVPALFAHGIDDDVVPYNCDYVFRGFVTWVPVIKLCGSGPMHDKAQEVGLYSILKPYPGAHVPWVDANGVPQPLFSEIKEEVVSFLYGQL